MKLKTFKRGVHPADMKYLSANEKIVEVIPVGEMVYPVSQHIGAPAEPVVAVGDRVLCGQMIAKANSFVSCNVFSSVSGTVKAIEPRPTVSGENCVSIVIDNDDRFEKELTLGVEQDYKKLKKDKIIEIIRQAGIVGLGGAGFPAHVKLSPKEAHKIDYLIVNAAECEPYLTSDYRLLLERTQDFLTGASIALSLFDNAKGVIGIENNKPAAVEKLETENNNEKISVLPLKTKYPQGAERMLIKAICGRELNSSLLPSDVGCVVINVATAVAIYDAVVKNTPLIKRVMTVSGDAVKKPCNLLVSIGMSHKQVLDAAGGFVADPKKVISGGPMMGTALFNLDIPVTKTSSSILGFIEDDVARSDTTACIHCGRCLHACPERLVPQMMMAAADNDLFDEFEKLNGMECVECGSCSYVCPAKRPLTQSFKYAKRVVAANRRKNAAK